MAKIALSAENMEFLRVTEENRKELEKAGGLAILFGEWIVKSEWTPNCVETPCEENYWVKTNHRGISTEELYNEFLKSI